MTINKIISKDNQNLTENITNNYDQSLIKIFQFSLNIDNFEVFNQEVLKVITSSLNVEFSYLLEYIESSQQIILKAQIGWDNEICPLVEQNLGQNEIGYAIAQKQHIYINNLKEDNRFSISDLLTNHQIISGLIFPFGKNIDQSHYILGIYTSQSRLFSEVEITFLEDTIQVLLSVFERNRQQEKSSLLERAIDSSTNGIIITEPNYHIIYANKGFETITGYTKKEILGKSGSFLHQNNLNNNQQKKDSQSKKINKIREALKNKQKIEIILKNYRKDGTLFWNQLHIAPVYNSDNVLTNFIGVQTDISTLIEIEFRLKEKTEILENFSRGLKLISNINLNDYEDINKMCLDYLKIGCQILDMEIGLWGEIINDDYVIQNYYCEKENLLLIGSEYSLKNNIFSLTVEAQKTIGYANFSQVNNFQNSYIENIAIESYLGTPIWKEGEICGILNFTASKPKKEIPLYQFELIELIAEGISNAIIFEQIGLESKQIEIALQENQERLDSILISLRDVIWSIHIETLQLLYINPAVEKLYEQGLGNFYHKRCYWLDLIHEEDMPFVKESYQNLLNISLFQNKQNSHDLEYRIILPDGREKYVRDRATLIFDTEGKPTRLDGIITDITKSKKTQLQLKKSEAEFRYLFEFAPIGMILISLDGYIQRVNQAFCDSLKYQSDELIGKEYFSFSLVEDLIKDLISQRKILSGEINFDDGEKRYVAKDNTIIDTIFKLTLLRDDQGNPLYFIQQIVDITERKKAENQLSHDALHDKLTGLVNRVLFLEHLDRALLRCKMDKDQLCAVLFLDLDQFKRLNESFGHHFGDQLLIQIARKIESVLDTKDIVARLGGDEFAILLDDLPSESMAIAITENILSICNMPLQVSNYEIFTSVSIGIAFSNIGYSKAEDMLRDADLTTYQAKEMGRNCYCIFDQKMHQKLLKSVEIESLLRKAIAKIKEEEVPQEFILYYQPIVSFRTRKLTGFEALIRWQNTNLGFISPLNFIPISEEIGLIITLGEWILLEAAKQAMEWEKMFPEVSLKIAVNLSGKQLNEQNLLSRVDNILNKTKVNPKLLKLEITESILMNNFDYGKKILKELQNRNFQISLDDFGTGYSSLSYLHSLPIDTLKIDRSFILPIEKNPEKSDIIKAIITLAHNLSLDVIAEGIETEKQASVLTQLNCDYGQGYLFSKPINAQEATDLIKKNISSPSDEKNN